jgi:biotin transport system substrate-specific component
MNYLGGAMSYVLSLNTPMQSIFWPRENSLIKQTLLVMAGVITLAISAHISIPLQPVPLTFQSAVVVLIGMAFGARLGMATLATYLIAGVCGLPVFTPSEFNLFSRPDIGYLIGFLPAVACNGYLNQKGWAKNILTSFISACSGASIIFLFGVTVLSQFVGWHNAIWFGLMPFIVTEPLKLLAVALIVPRFWKKR